jgi:hypothetical protein
MTDVFDAMNVISIVPGTAAHTLRLSASLRETLRVVGCGEAVGRLIFKPRRQPKYLH